MLCSLDRNQNQFYLFWHKRGIILSNIGAGDHQIWNFTFTFLQITFPGFVFSFVIFMWVCCKGLWIWSQCILQKKKEKKWNNLQNLSYIFALPIEPAIYLGSLVLVVLLEQVELQLPGPLPWTSGWHIQRHISKQTWHSFSQIHKLDRQVRRILYRFSVKKF